MMRPGRPDVSRQFMSADRWKTTIEGARHDEIEML
jgi:hypothetical protein